MSKHYTAMLTITATEKAGTMSKPERDVDEVAKLVLKADNLQSLRDRLAAHVALIEED